MRNRVQNVVRHQLEVASKAQLYDACEPLAQLGKPLLNKQSFVGKHAARVRCANDPSHSLVGCFLRHLERTLQARRPVVHSVDQMMMNVDHCCVRFQVSGIGIQLLTDPCALFPIPYSLLPALAASMQRFPIRPPNPAAPRSIDRDAASSPEHFVPRSGCLQCSRAIRWDLPPP